MDILKLKKLIALTVAIFFMIPMSTFAQQSATLRLKLKMGQAFDVVVGSDMQMQMKMGDTVMQMNMEMEQRMEYQVFKVEDNGNMELGTTPKASKTNMEMMNGMTMKYDSDNPDLEDPTNQAMHDAFSKTLGKTFKMTMTPIGKVTEYSGFEEYLDEALGGEGASAGVKEIFGDESMKELMQQFTGLYPEGEVKIGDTWEVTLNWKALGMDVVYDYTLLELNDGVAKIGTKGKMDFDLGELMGTMTQMKEEMGFDYELLGTIDGYFELNATDGWIENMVQNMTMTGAMKMNLPEGASPEEAGMEGATIDEQGRMVIPMTMKLEQTMKRDK